MKNERTTQQVALYLAGTVAGLGVVVGLLLAATIGGAWRAIDREQRALGLERDAQLQTVRVVAAGATELALAGGLVGVVVIGLMWLERRSRLIYPRNGLFPLIRLRQGEIVYDPNRGPASSPAALLGALEVQRCAALSGGGIIEATPRQQVLPAAGAVVEGGTLPARVELADLFRNRQPSLQHLVVGVGVDGPIAVSLNDLMHTLTVGASGWGKSNWLRQLIWQIAQAPEQLSVVGIDVYGSEFNLLREWDRLRFPIARSIEDAEAVLEEVNREIRRRRDLWEQVPLASDLESYNRITGARLEPWLVMADEATNMLNQSGIGRPLRTVAQTARQYGVYLLLAGQSVKAEVLDTQTRDQFSTRICFRLAQSSSRVVLDDRVAADLSIKGRAYVQLSGRPRMEIQTPFIEREELAAVLTGGGPRHQAPTPAQAPVDERALRVMEMHDEGVSDTAIAEQVFGHNNGHYIEKVRSILRQRQPTA